MNALDVVPYDGRVVQFQFEDGECVRAKIVSVDPDVAENQVFYVLLEVVVPSSSRSRSVPVGSGCAVSVQEIISIAPAEWSGPIPSLPRPWWKFW